MFGLAPEFVIAEGGNSIEWQTVPFHQIAYPEGVSKIHPRYEDSEYARRQEAPQTRPSKALEERWR